MGMAGEHVRDEPGSGRQGGVRRVGPPLAMTNGSAGPPLAGPGTGSSTLRVVPVPRRMTRNG